MKNLRLLMVAGVAVFALTLAGCGGGGGGATAPVDTPQMPDPAIAERMAISGAIDAAEDAVGMVNDTSGDAAVDAANAAIAAARTAIADATSLPDAEKAAHGRTVSALETTLAGAKTSRTAYMTMQADEARMAMAATARKLYAGISVPLGGIGGLGPDTIAAAYDADDETTIRVKIGEADFAFLSPTKMTVADNHGWAGTQYTRSTPASEGTYEAVVYSNVGEPTQGKKFGGAAANNEFEYALTNGAITVDTSTAAVQARVAFTGVTRTAGTETFKLPSPNPGGATNILVPGSFHGVSGTYSCAPSTPADGCSAAVAAKGFTLAGGTWTFTPGDANARVADVPDADYVSYGWWIHKAVNDGDFTASVFWGVKGTVPEARNLNALNGTATYVGGAAGKYALYSATGGTNDAGHFTARATLEADFTSNTEETAISGTIDNFTGADGEARDWEVKLNGSQIGDDGLIGRGSGNTGADTAWTIGVTAASDSGEWDGRLYDNGDDGVPQVAAGTFYSEYGLEGKMVGAFGANRQ